MFKQIWQNLKNPAIKGKKSLFSQGNKSVSTEALPSLNDSDYEFLWLQLLEGMAHGWHSQKLVHFFKVLGERGKEELWLSWLNRFEEKLLTSPSPNQQLGAKMVQFGQKTQDYPSIRKIGEKSSQIGRQLLNRQPGSTIWEYDGPDLIVVSSEVQTDIQMNIQTNIQTDIQTDIQTETPKTQEVPLSDLLPKPELSYENAHPSPSEPQDSVILPLKEENKEIEDQVEPQILSSEDEQLSSDSSVPDPWQDTPANIPPQAPEPQVETLTFNELIARLKTDQNLRVQVANQLGVDSEDFQGLIATLQEKMQIPVEPVSPPPPVTAVNTDEPPEYEKLFYQGLEKADQGQMLEAIACWDQALELNPNISAIWHNRGSALGHLGRLEDAIASFDRAILINPKDYQAWNDRGNAFYNLQQWDNALNSWDNALQIKSDFTQAWYSRGCVLEHLNRLEEALRSYDKAIELKPDFEIAINRRNKLQQ